MVLALRYKDKFKIRQPKTLLSFIVASAFWTLYVVCYYYYYLGKFQGVQTHMGQISQCVSMEKKILQNPETYLCGRIKVG